MESLKQAVPSWLRRLIQRYEREQTLVDASHPFVFAVYGAIVASGVQYMLGFQEAAALTEWIGPRWTNAWWVGLIVAGSLGLWGVIMAVASDIDQRVGLRIETAGCVAVVITQVMYLLALDNADVSANQTRTYAVAFAAAAALRAATMPLEFGKVRYHHQVLLGSE